MCLGVPGQVMRLSPNEIGMTMGTVRFGGIRKEVCLAYTPEAKVGDYVLVHVGFALAVLDEKAAGEMLQALREMGELEGLEGAAP